MADHKILEKLSNLLSKQLELILLCEILCSRFILNSNLRSFILHDACGKIPLEEYISKMFSVYSVEGEL